MALEEAYKNSKNIEVQIRKLIQCTRGLYFPFSSFQIQRFCFSASIFDYHYTGHVNSLGGFIHSTRLSEVGRFFSFTIISYLFIATFIENIIVY